VREALEAPRLERAIGVIYRPETRPGDEYDTEAITHVMGCTSHFPGELLR
jgi:hypothetical protein